jgi:hypothetical protein
MGGGRQIQRKPGKIISEDLLNIAVYGGLGFLALFFYLFIPGLGAFLIRSRWRRFRKSVVAASLYPEVTYKDVHSSGQHAPSERPAEGNLLYEQPSGAAGSYYFLGVLEAIQEDDIIWLRNDDVALSADMKGQKVFLLPSQTVSGEGGGEDPDDYPKSDETPQVLAWEKVGSLPEGIQVLVAGPLRIANRRGRFRSEKKGDLLVVFYDGDKTSLLKRAVWHGRQRNEYWNPFTLGSLGAGFLSGMILSYFFLQNSRTKIPAILSIIMSLVPLIPVLPPGMLFFVLYRRLWRRGRFLRAERDLLRLPPRRFGEDGAKAGSLPAADPAALAEKCERKAVRLEEFSLALFCLGFLVNLYLVLKGLAWFFR